MKKCSRCKKEKDFSEFGKEKKGKNGLKSICKKCCTKRQKIYLQSERGKIVKKRYAQSEKGKIATKRYYQHNKETYAKHSKLNSHRHNLKRHNLTLTDYDQMFDKQNGNCAICGLPELTRRLAVDHNHKTGKVRALLCLRCNMELGVYENKREILEKYLKEWDI